MNQSTAGGHLQEVHSRSSLWTKLLIQVYTQLITDMPQVSVPRWAGSWQALIIFWLLMCLLAALLPLWP